MQLVRRRKEAGSRKGEDTRFHVRVNTYSPPGSDLILSLHKVLAKKSISKLGDWRKFVGEQPGATKNIGSSGFLGLTVRHPIEAPLDALICISSIIDHHSGDQLCILSTRILPLFLGDLHVLELRCFFRTYAQLTNPQFEAANWVETEMLVKFPDEHWISLTQAGRYLRDLKMMNNGKIEEHGGDIYIYILTESHNLFVAAFEQLHSGNFIKTEGQGNKVSMLDQCQTCVPLLKFPFWGG